MPVSKTLNLTVLVNKKKSQTKALLSFFSYAIEDFDSKIVYLLEDNYLILF